MSPPGLAVAPLPRARNLAEEVYTYLGIVRRGWRLIAIGLAIALTAATIYLARGETVYKASARLLNFQQGGRPLSVGPGSDPFQHLQAQDSLATHLLIIKSPAGVERAMASDGLPDSAIESVVTKLTVTQPSTGAKVVDIGYQAEASDLAASVIKAVVESDNPFLRENYQKDTREVISLIVKARDDLSRDLRKLTTGPDVSNPAELLASDGLGRAVEGLRSAYD